MRNVHGGSLGSAKTFTGARFSASMLLHDRPIASNSASRTFLCVSAPLRENLFKGRRNLTKMRNGAEGRASIVRPVRLVEGFQRSTIAGSSPLRHFFSVE